MTNHLNLGICRAAIFVVLLFGASFARAQAPAPQRQRVVAGANRDYPPYEFVDQNGRAVGFDIDVLRAAGDAVFIDVEVRSGKWTDLRAEVQNGSLDLLAGMLYSPDRARSVEFSVPYQLVEYCVFIRDDHPEILGNASLVDEEVLVEENSQMHEFAKERGFKHIIPVASEPEAIRQLARGRGKIALAPLLEATSLIHRESLTNVRTSGGTLYSRNLCFAARKGDRDLIEKLNTGLAIINSNGKFDRIYRKWFGTAQVEVRIWDSIRPYVVSAAIGVFLLMLIAFAWVRTLRNQVNQRTRALKAELAERSRAENQLRLSEAKYRTLVEGAADGIFVADDNLVITDANEAGCRMLGYTKEELVGKSVADLYAPEHLQGKPFDRDSLFSGEVVRNERIAIRADGTRFHVESSARRIGENLFQGMIRDITSQREAKEQMIRLNEELEGRVAERTRELERANHELESFSYSVAHDLRAPLRAMDGYATILLREHGSEFSGEAGDLLQRISANARRMGMLIDALLGYARMSRTPLQMVTVDMTELVREALEPLREVNRDWTGLADIAQLPKVDGDPTLLKLVFHNLLENAIKFSSDSEEPAIKVGFDPEHRAFFVQDNGIGFDQKYADKLFKVFERIHSGQFEGTGVGLATVKRIVERHGGEVWAKGELGKGASFWFTIPTVHSS